MKINLERCVGTINEEGIFIWACAVVHLIGLGDPEAKAYEWGNARKSTGEFHIVHSYTKPLTSPIGKAKGQKFI